MKNNWLAKIEQIHSEIERAADCGLGFEGRIGEIMFLMSYDKMKGSIESRNLILKLLNNEIDDYNAGRGYYSVFWGGLSSLGWAVNMLLEQGYIDDDFGFNDYNESILEGALKQISVNNDYLNGSLGMLYYLMNVPDKEKARSFATVALEKLSQLAEISPDGSIKWMQDKKQACYNISLSHGISSIVCVLCMISALGVNQAECSHLIEGAVKYILNQRLPSNGKFVSFFPNFALESSEELTSSRLAWCYGDLGIAIMLHRAATVMGRRDWDDEAMKILQHAALQRRNPVPNMVIDACFCHGSSGIAYIFKFFGRVYGIDALDEAAEYWTEFTLNCATYNDAPAGYKFYGGYKEGFVPGYGILEGIAGVGLSLIGCAGYLDSDWDRCLLFR